MFGFREFVSWLGEDLFSDVVEHGEFGSADDCVAAGVVVLPFLAVGYGLCEFLGGLSFWGEVALFYELLGVHGCGFYVLGFKFCGCGGCFLCVGGVFMGDVGSGGCFG